MSATPPAPSHDMRALLQASHTFLDTFLSSPSSQFAIFRTYPPTSSSLTTSIRTLFILDSSFNPPSLAHLTLATSALAAPRTRYPGPRRLLLLFSVHNADKKAAPAAFEQRLAMMAVFAEDLAERIRLRGLVGRKKVGVAPASTIRAHGEVRAEEVREGRESEDEEEEEIAIDVGLTKQPYYNDKTAAIEEAGAYPTAPTHIHLTGYDTYVRIFTPRYYPNHHPPLSALDPFLSKHGLRVTIRADGDNKEWGTAEEQREVIQRLGRGELELEGGRREWARRVEVEEGEEEGRGVSSTRVREAVGKGDWATVGNLCTPRVVGWIKAQGVYGQEGQGGSKMA